MFDELDSNQPEIKETAWDSSCATLYRIDTLIKVLHKSRFKEYEERNDEIYLNALDRLFMEAVSKMDTIEEQEAKTFQAQLKEIQLKWKDDINKPLIYNKLKFSGHKWQSNLNYLIAQNEILTKARDYEIFLIKTMDRHGMLLKNNQTAMARFRGNQDGN